MDETLLNKWINERDCFYCVGNRWSTWKCNLKGLEKKGVSITYFQTIKHNIIIIIIFVLRIEGEYTKKKYK